jgi:hypothetical protein
MHRALLEGLDWGKNHLMNLIFDNPDVCCTSHLLTK